MSSLDTPERKSAAELIDEHRELFERIAAMDDEAPELARRFGTAPLEYADERLEDDDA